MSDRFFKEGEWWVCPYNDAPEVKAARHLIRRQADVPVLVSAIKSRPDWLISNNRKHFTSAVARRTGLRIGNPEDFFRSIHVG